MKNILIALSLLFSTIIFGQVIIGNGKLRPSSSSVSLEFGNENKGILLPAVDSESAVNQAVPGTLIFDALDKKVKLRLSNSWKDMSIVSNGKMYPTPAFISEAKAAKVTIGSTVSSTAGILVLEDTNKAMILPTVKTYADIINPSAGMMVYLSGVNQVAFYNGSVWTFWQPD